jgi:putative hydrolase of the HAD superfamily
VWTQLLTELEHPTERAPEFADLYQSERTARYRLFDDVESVLHELAPRYDLVLVTNGMSDLQRHKIELLRLERWFPHMLVSGEVGSWKPHPDIFLEALRRTGAGPQEAVMVGDSQPRDVSGARGVGIRTIWLKRYAHQQQDPAHPSDAVAESLRAVADLADGWFAHRV